MQRTEGVSHYLLTSFAALVLTVVSSCATAPVCPDPDVSGVLKNWNVLDPTKAATSGSRAVTETERVTNREGVTFVNVHVGIPDIRSCHCCETFSFEDTGSGTSLVSMVATRRHISKTDALLLAERLWHSVTDDQFTIADRVRDGAGPLHIVQQSHSRLVGDRSHPVEILVASEESGDGYFVRFHIGV